MKAAFAALDRNICDWHFWWSVGMVHLWFAVFRFVTVGFEVTGDAADELVDAIAFGVLSVVVMVLARWRNRLTRHAPAEVQP